MTVVMNQSLKSLHDALLAEKPEGAVHDPAGCPLCALEEPASAGEPMTYTEDDLRAKVDDAVKAAVAEKDQKIAELTASALSSETDQAVATAVAAKDEEIATLHGELDKATLALASATTEKDAILAWLEGEATAIAERAAIVARKDERLAKLKEVASFPEAYLADNADRFAAMADEEFTSRLAEYAALSGTRTPSEIPAGTPGLKAGQEGPERNGHSAVKDLMAHRRDPRGHVDLATL